MRSRWLFITIALTLFFGAVAAFAVLTLQAKPYRDAASLLPLEMAAARAEGLPLTPEEAFVRQVPESANAAPTIVKAIDELQKVKDHRTLIESASKLILEGKPKEALVKLEPLAPALRLVESAREFQELEFERNWSNPIETPFPEFSHIKDLVKAKGFQAEAFAATGRPAEAMDALVSGAHLSSLLRHERTLIGMLVRIACEAIVGRSAERVADIWARDGMWLERLQNLARSGFGPDPDFIQSLTGEVIYGIYAPKDLDAIEKFAATDGFMGDGVKVPRIPGLDRKVQSQAYQTRALQFWRRAFGAMEPHRKDPLRASQVLGALSEREAANRAPTYELNAIVLPVFDQAGTAVVRLQARRLLLETKVRVLRYRLRTSKFPEKLSEAGIEVVDPFNRKPLRYVREAGGFKIWSVDVDIEDDGGQVGPQANTGDIVMFYPFRPK